MLKVMPKKKFPPEQMPGVQAHARIYLFPLDFGGVLPCRAARGPCKTPFLTTLEHARQNVTQLLVSSSARHLLPCVDSFKAEPLVRNLTSRTQHGAKYT